jgi:hypothetical protein
MNEHDTSGHFDLEQLTSDAYEIAAYAAQRVPRRGAWGLESFGDGPAALGGGFGGFLWFSSRDELLEFVRSNLVFAFGGINYSAVQQVSRRVRSIVDGDELTSETREHLNWVLKGYSQLRWWGEFNTLLAGDGPFEQSLRASYREEARGPDASPDSTPIRASELDEFVSKAVLMYGI